MKQRIEIRNFGPIRNVELDISDYMIFIGPNASGKSTIAKLVYFFESFSFALSSAIPEMRNDTDTDHFLEYFCNYLKDLFKKHFDKFWDRKGLQNFEVTFYCAEDESPADRYVVVQLTQNNDNFGVNFGERFINILAQCIDAMKTNVADGDKQQEFLGQQLFCVFQKIYKHFNLNGVLFIPDGRQMLTLPVENYPIMNRAALTQNMQDFIQSVNFIKKKFDSFIDKLTEKYQNEQKLGQYHYKTLELACCLVNKILKGKYICTREGERIYLDEERFIKLYEASSGQQEVLWILNLIVEIIASVDQKTILDSQRFTIIEEPEAHLFPESQRDLTNLISLLANQKNEQVLITTHSPYILTALNNLLYAHKIGKTKPDETAKIIAPMLWVDVDKVAVYMVENGTIRDIVDRDLEMICTEEIGSASRIMNQEFDTLFALED